MCKRGRVSDVLFSTIEPPPEFDVTGRGCLVQAKVLRLKKDLKGGEANAKEVSEALPFIEYEIHRQLLNKLKVKGMNAMFGVRMKLSVADRAIVGVATGTACFLTALPTPTTPRLLVSASSWQQNADPTYLRRSRDRLEQRVKENAAFFGVDGESVAAARAAAAAAVLPEAQSAAAAVTHEAEADFTAGNKDSCVLEVSSYLLSKCPWRHLLQLTTAVVCRFTAARPLANRGRP